MGFSLSSLFIGLLILAGGGATVVFYRQIAENVAHGVMDYDKVRIIGIIAIVVGFLVMTNLHSVILNALVDIIFPS